MMRNPIRSTTRIAAAVAIAASVAVGAGAVSAGEAAADGFPNGPYCNGPAKVLAESAWSQVAICPVQGPTGWEYSGKGKVTGNTIDLWGAPERLRLPRLQQRLHLPRAPRPVADHRPERRCGLQRTVDQLHGALTACVGRRPVGTRSRRPVTAATESA